jgi:hypothetical protein
MDIFLISGTFGTLLLQKLMSSTVIQDVTQVEEEELPSSNMVCLTLLELGGSTLLRINLHHSWLTKDGTYGLETTEETLTHILTTNLPLRMTITGTMRPKQRWVNTMSILASGSSSGMLMSQDLVTSAMLKETLNSGFIILKITDLA